ncbi:SIR2 family protein [Hymenobacter setariae]|uniref:SIR2 family protein n=1 Tax=Hymenobacter setariae TaxID=2594794 RepID=A0A558BMW7_9BACT|nr:SIR2 family protein [Hymenobacter setariae]TVT37861.1 SIR2 family protein [Hymenobacter setariae]
MKRLIREFEEQVRADLTADGDVQIGGVKMSPLAILDPGSETYDAEYLRWRDEEWLPSRFERRDSILALVPDNRARFTDLSNALKRQVVLPFVGAGMSLSSGMKTWGRFLHDLREAGSCPEADLHALLTGSTPNYEAAADLVHSSMSRKLFLNRMNTRFQVAAEQVAGPVRLLPHLFAQRVFTTNFDHVLEHVYTEEGMPFEFVLRGNQYLERAAQTYDRTRPSLLKLHGDEQAPSQRVFTREEYDRAYADESFLRRELGRAVSGTDSLLFLGCSLTSDRTMAVLRAVAQADAGEPEHYAFLPYDANTHQVRENFLADHGIYPIWYDAPTPADHDEAIEALLVGLLREQRKL